MWVQKENQADSALKSRYILNIVKWYTLKYFNNGQMLKGKDSDFERYPAKITMCTQGTDWNIEEVTKKKYIKFCFYGTFPHFSKLSSKEKPI